MARATWDVRQVSGRSFLNGRYESPDTLSTVDIDLPPMLGNPVNPYDGASSVQSARSRSPENHADHIPSSTPPVPSYSHGPRQFSKRRSQSQGKPGQAAPISAPRMKHPIVSTWSQIFSCDVKDIIICILVGMISILVVMIMTTSMWDTVTLPQPGTYIWFLAASVSIALFAYMFYFFLHGHKRQGSKLSQNGGEYPLQTTRLNLVNLRHPNSWRSRHTRQFLQQHSSILGERFMNEILEKFDGIRGKEFLNPNLVNEQVLEYEMNITSSILRHRLMELINLLREKFNTSANSKGGNVENIEAHTVFMHQSQQINHGCNQSFSAPVPVKRAQQAPV